MIQSGQLRAGERFFSESELVRKYGLSRGTVCLALQSLIREGLLRVARLLEIPPRSPILQMERTVFSDLDEPIESARSLFRSDRFSISVRSVRTNAGAGNSRSNLR